MPLRPWFPAELSSERFRNVTTIPAPLITMPLVPATRTPARFPPPSIVIDLVIVTAPKPPGSSTSMKPAVAVLLIAPAKVLHGAVRLQGFASSPTPDTQVRDAWAWATEAIPRMSVTAIPILLTLVAVVADDPKLILVSWQI